MKQTRNNEKRTRNDELKRLRDSGLTFKEIGEILGISATRVQHILIAQKKKKDRIKGELDRAKKLLEDNGYKVESLSDV